MRHSTARLLVVVMLLAQGRLLACGLECMDQLAAPAEASCHTESAPALALNGDAAHACLPEVAEARVTVTKAAKGKGLVAAPLAALLIASDPSDASRQHRFPVAHSRQAPPHSPAPTVLRI
jgi:hypothetical protein